MRVDILKRNGKLYIRLPEDFDNSKKYYIDKVGNDIILRPVSSISQDIAKLILDKDS